LKLEPPLAHLKPPDPAAWAALVASADGASVFHSAAWAGLWTGEWRGARWEAIAHLDASGGYAGAIGAVVRRRGFFRSVDAMPFATYGGPIVRRGHPEASAIRRALLDAFARWIGGRFVLRSGLSWYEGVPEELPEGFPAVESFTHVVKLGQPFDELADGFASSTRKLVRQAEESGLAIRTATSEEDLRAYYALVVGTVRRRGGTPKPYSVYRRILRDLVPTGLARYHLVSHGEETVAGSLHLFHEGTAMNWLTVSLASSWHLRPNNFLISRVLSSLCDAGYLEYNLGGSAPDAHGLIRFKEGWGASRRRVLIASNRSGLHRRLRTSSA